MSNSGSEIIIEKHWRGYRDRAICEEFWNHVTKEENPKNVLPIIATHSNYFVHIQNSGLFYMIPIDAEVPPLLIIGLFYLCLFVGEFIFPDFLHRVVSLFKEYFKTSEISEEVLKDNFVTVYQVT